MAVPDSPIAVLLAVHNRLALTQRCIAALRVTARSRLLKLIVIDDGSTDGTTEWLAGEPEVTRLRGNGDLWFGGAIDLGLRHLLEKFSDCFAVLILNNDTFVHSEALEAMIGAMTDEKVVTAAFWIEDRELAGTSGFDWQSWRGLRDVCVSVAWREQHALGSGRFVPVDAVATTLTLIPMPLLRRTRLPDPQLHPHNRYDAILSARLRAAGARFLCSTAFLASHLYGPLAQRPTVRNMSVKCFLRESFQDRRTIHHLAGGLALAVETAPTRIEAGWAVVLRLVRFLRQLAWVTLNSVTRGGLPRGSGKLQPTQ